MDTSVPKIGPTYAQRAAAAAEAAALRLAEAAEVARICEREDEALRVARSNDPSVRSAMVSQAVSQLLELLPREPAVHGLKLVATNFVAFLKDSFGDEPLIQALQGALT